MKRKSCFLFLLLLLLLFLLTSCNSVDDTNFPSTIWSGVSESFVWFFEECTPAYFSYFDNIWGLLDVLDSSWELPSLIGLIIAILMSVAVFLIALLISIVYLVLYLVLLAIFLAVFAVLLVIAVLLLLCSAIITLLFYPFQ